MSRRESPSLSFCVSVCIFSSPLPLLPLLPSDSEALSSPLLSLSLFVCRQAKLEPKPTRKRERDDGKAMMTERERESPCGAQIGDQREEKREGGKEKERLTWQLCPKGTFFC